MSSNNQDLAVGEKDTELTAGDQLTQIEELKSVGEADDIVTLPEGGLQAWGTVLGGFLVQFCAFGYTGAFGAFQDYYVRVHLTEETPSNIAWIGSIQAFLIIVVGIPAGRIHDCGHISSLMLVGSLIVSVSLFMLSMTKPNQYYQVLLSQGFGAGIGLGIIFVPSIAIQSHYFSRRRSLVMAVVTSGSSLGAMIHPIMLNNLFSTIGFAGATRANAGLISGLLFVSCLLMRTRLPPLSVAPNFKQAFVKFSKDKAYICCSLSLLFFIFGVYFPIFYLQLDAIRHNLSPVFAFYSLVIFNGGGLLGRLIAGIISSNSGVRVEIIMIISSLCYGALLFAGVVMSSLASISAMGVIYGVFAGIYTGLIAPMMANLADDVSETGLRIGVGFALAGFADLFAGPIDGALLTTDNHWWRPAAFSGAVSIMACFLLVAMMFCMRKK